MYNDYRDKVNFYYVYKTVEHSGVNGFVEPFSLEERLKHVAIAKSRLKTEIPWICDNMQNDTKHLFGGAPNGEYVLDPEGKIVRKRFWSDATTLRSDLEALVGKSEKTTAIKDVTAGFDVNEAKPRTEKVASGVMPKVELPANLFPLKMDPLPSDHPFFAKLRVEATRGVREGTGRLHFVLSLDPLYGVHWNNLAGKVQIDLQGTDIVKFPYDGIVSKKIAAEADIDPRHFLIDINSSEITPETSFRVKVIYHVCDDDETFCVDVEQEYQVYLDVNRDGGTRPGIFMVKMFKNLKAWDKDQDGNITLTELPETQADLIMRHLDYSGDNVADSDETERFLKMFNNGNGLGDADGEQEKDAAEKDSAEEDSDGEESGE